MAFRQPLPDAERGARREVAAVAPAASEAPLQPPPSSAPTRSRSITPPRGVRDEHRGHQRVGDQRRHLQRLRHNRLPQIPDRRLGWQLPRRDRQSTLRSAAPTSATSITPSPSYPFTTPSRHRRGQQATLTDPIAGSTPGAGTRPPEAIPPAARWCSRWCRAARTRGGSQKRTSMPAAPGSWSASGAPRSRREHRCPWRIASPGCPVDRTSREADGSRTPRSARTRSRRYALRFSNVPRRAAATAPYCRRGPLGQRIGERAFRLRLVRGVRVLPRGCSRRRVDGWIARRGAVSLSLAKSAS